ncbi:integral membrane protein [Fusarium pseudoanthophilum]|uniref:Integral membrane protein n=1 Tax=Fusarium pseudoanthophilum TaxID=48495 RepID=A0A8H5KIU7_9HYPO|nr:integral membrane protein [Fusarium pseudoanthophilum]
MIDRGMGFPADGVDNHGWKLYITSLVMIISSGLFVVARCIARYSIHKLGSDDVAIIVSLISSVLLSTYIQLAIHHGYGMHKADLEKPDLRMALKMFFIAQTPYKATVCLNKVAAILLYLRLFVTKSFRIWSFVVLGVVVGYSIGGIAATIWQCVPIKGAWDKSVDAKCIDSNKFWVAYAVLNILTDVMVLALPIMPIVRLQTSRREKLLLCCIFLLGGFVTITSILRVTSVSNSLRNKKDMTWNFIDRGVWTLIEANLGIIAACLPVLRQPLGKLFPRIFGSTKKSSLYYTGPGGPAKGYNLSDIAARSPRPGIWKSDASGSEQVISVGGPQTEASRESDERCIIANTVKGSDYGSELATHKPGLSR